MMIWQPEKVIIPTRRFCRYCDAELSGTYHRDICDSSKCKKRARHDDYIKHKDKCQQRSKKNQTKYPHVCPTCNKSFMGAKNQVYHNRSCAHLKLHIYHDRIVALSEQGYSLLEIAKDISEGVNSVRYYYKKHVRKDCKENA